MAVGDGWEVLATGRAAAKVSGSRHEKGRGGAKQEMKRASKQESAKLWLDDITSAPAGWIWARNFQEAVDFLRIFPVEQMSFDHDLGWCPTCQYQDRMVLELGISSCTCGCHRSGYNLVSWMEENNCWP